MRERRFKPGTPVIFQKLKHGSRPSPQAREVSPELRGEGYRYRVDKFWVVLEHRTDNMLLVLTRSGKRHLICSDDPNLRRASWWEWLRYRGRFPATSVGSSSVPQPQVGG